MEGDNTEDRVRKPVLYHETAENCTVSDRLNKCNFMMIIIINVLVE